MPPEPPPEPPLATRRFSPADQDWFAELTGDTNPLHVDPVAARRGLFGAPVVHGMHATAWALERFIEHEGRTGEPFAALGATFAKPLFVDEPVEVFLATGDSGSRRLVVHAGGGPAIDVRMGRAAAGGVPPAPDPRDGAGGGLPPVPDPRDGTETPPPPPACREWTMDDIAGASGAMAVRSDRSALAAAFPALTARLGAGRLAGWLGLSPLVGMECPGRDALFSAFDVRFDEGAANDPGTLRYAVERVDRRFSMVRLSVHGSGLAGTVTAFVRPPPEHQPAMDEIAAGVRSGAWAGQRALVVGGSRGLGEVTAKLVAAGGGDPVITYRTGRDDAARVADEIRAWGGTGEAVELDVADPDGPLTALAARGWTPTHVYYYATPRIFTRRTRVFDPVLFRRFASVYVDGFLAVHEACRAVADGPLALFYPSTVAIDDDVRELTEYAAAKAAGESLCRSLDRFAPDTRVLVERLPRIATDQTATLMPVPAADAADVLRRIVATLAGD